MEAIVAMGADDGLTVLVLLALALCALFAWVEYQAALHRFELRYQRRRMATERRHVGQWPDIAP